MNTPAHIVAFFAALLPAFASELKSATSHPMRYYIALPHGWSAAHSWPVVVAIEGARRDFRADAEDFERARGEAPFILVVPLVVTNGGTSGMTSPPYNYSPAVWKRVAQDGAFQFDSDGIATVIADVQREYHGEVKYFLTGWEAGGHTVWAMVFRHPEALRAAALATPNYQGRWMDEGSFSRSPERAALPVKVLQAGTGPEPWPNPFFKKQLDEALQAASAHGFRNVSSSIADGRTHGALAEETLAFFKAQLLPPAR